MLAVTLLWAVLAAAPAVEGNSDCPHPPDVAGRLEGLLGPGVGEGERVGLDRVAGQLRLELSGRDGRSLVVRYLASAATCAELAEIAAVTVAAWLLQPAAPQETSLPPLEVAKPRGASQSGVAWRLAAAFAASFAGTEFAPGAALDLTIGGRRSRLAALLGLAITDSRSDPLGMGRVSWTRRTYVLGLEGRRRARHLDLTAHVETAVAQVQLTGSGFGASKDDDGFDAALGGGIRVRTAGAISPWVDLSVRYWLLPQRAYVADPLTSFTLPSTEILLSAGMSVGSRE